MKFVAPSFSIVVNTYNRADYLENTLNGLCGLRYPDVEIIVVNGPSDDGTSEILKRWQDRVRIGHCSEVNLSMSRNKGIELAAGEVVCFIDDDAVPHPRWLEMLAPHYLRAKVAGVGGFTIDNTGKQYQVRKTICDRYGNGHNVSEFFDERALNFEGTPYYPSLLGTNSSFRRSALEEIGGFDHVFAYFLDETDVCLRLVDAGYQIIYEPDALVFHQFAPSHLRNGKKLPKTLYPSAKSKSYFMFRHGGKQSEAGAIEQLAAYKEEILRANKWLADHGDISSTHRTALDQDFLLALNDGTEAARVNFSKTKGDLVPSTERKRPKTLAARRNLRVALVSHGYPPRVEAGIAIWTSMVADGLIARGVDVHIVTSVEPGQPESISFEKGRWFHRLLPAADGHKPLSVKLNLPENISAWAYRVWQEIQSIKSFGLDIVSFPIWDLEGVSLIGDPDVAVVMSLHTSYAMAKPFKPEWNARPIYEYFMVSKMISGEAQAIKNVDVVLANSQAIINDLQNAYGFSFEDKAVTATHGTYDILGSEQISISPVGSPLRVLYVGRFEPRKGFDIAVAAVSRLLTSNAEIQVTFMGGDLDSKATQVLGEFEATYLQRDDRVEFIGLVDRDDLDLAFLQHDVVIMPSRYESFGLVAIEAMSAGTPVIALAAGGLAEVVEDGISGYLVRDDEGAVDAIEKHVQLLADDRSALTELAMGARRQFLSRFTIEKMVDEVLVAYNKAIEIKGVRDAHTDEHTRKVS